MTAIEWKLIVAVVLGTSLAVLEVLLMFAMIGEINRKVPESERIPYFRWSWRRFAKEYRQLYPDGNLTRWYRICGLGTWLVFGYAVLVLLGVV